MSWDGRMLDSGEIPVDGIIHSLLKAIIGVCQIRHADCTERELPAESREEKGGYHIERKA